MRVSTEKYLSLTQQPFNKDILGQTYAPLPLQEFVHKHIGALSSKIQLWIQDDVMNISLYPVRYDCDFDISILITKDPLIGFDVDKHSESDESRRSPRRILRK